MFFGGQGKQVKNELIFRSKLQFVQPIQSRRGVRSDEANCKTPFSYRSSLQPCIGPSIWYITIQILVISPQKMGEKTSYIREKTSFFTRKIVFLKKKHFFGQLVFLVAHNIIERLCCDCLLLYKRLKIHWCFDFTQKTDTFVKKTCSFCF